MFTALYLKEWREKAIVFFFELGILGLLLAAPFALRGKTDLQEWLVYAILLLFFPFAAPVRPFAGSCLGVRAVLRFAAITRPP